MEKFSYMARPNLEYIDNLYTLYQTHPQEIDPYWQKFFEGMEFSQSLLKKTPSSNKIPSTAPEEKSFSQKELGVYNLIQFYRDYGHLKASLDPLQMQRPQTKPFELSHFDLNETDLEQKFPVGSALGHSEKSLQQMIEHLEKAYCGTLTAQLAECPPEVRAWFREEFEVKGAPQLNRSQKTEIYHQLARTETLEKFIHTRYVGTKRFSIEGGDALIPMLENLASQGTAQGVKEIVIGMAHRGRINVLANFMDKAIEVIFSEFDGTAFKDLDFEGDVK